jgi:hydrogenase maturation protease
MPDLREQFQQLFQGRVCLMGLGNIAHGDDGVGVRLAEALATTEYCGGDAQPRNSGDFRVAFPLTPALSPGERETRRPAFDQAEAHRFVGRRDMIPPLPWGEGRGEGKAFMGLGRRYNVFIAGTTPERWISQVEDEGFDRLVFLDAVEFGGSPGSVVLLDSDEMAVRFPQISTHKLSLGLLAKQAEANARTEAWLLGVQPESLRPREELTPTVRATLEMLLDLLTGCLRTACPGGRASPQALAAGTDEGCLGSRGRSPSRAAEVMA